MDRGHLLRFAAAGLFSASVACGGAQTPATQVAPPEAPPVTAGFVDDEDSLPAARAEGSARARGELVPQNVHRAYIRSLFADPHARYFIAVDDDAVISLHDAETGQIKAVERAAIRRSNPPTISADRSGTRIAVGVSGADAEPSRTYAWDLEAGTFDELVHADTTLYASTLAAMAPAGDRVFALSARRTEEAEDETFLEARDFASHARVLGPLAVPNAQSVYVSPSGALVVVRTYEPSALLLLSASSLEPLGTVSGVTSDPVFHPRGGQLLVAAESELVVRSPRDGRALGSVRIDEPIERIVYASDGACLATFSSAGALRMRRARTLEPVHEANAGEITGALVLPDCSGVLTLRHGGDLVRHRPGLGTEGEVMATVAQSTASRYGSFGPLADVGHGRLAVGAGEEVALLDATTGNVQTRIAGGSGERSIWHARFDARGSALYVSGRGFLDIWDAAGARATSCGGPSVPRLLHGGAVLVDSPSGICDPATGTVEQGYAVSTAEGAPVVLAADSSSFFTYDATRRTRSASFLTPGARDCPNEGQRCGDLGVVSRDGTRVAIALRAPSRVLIFDTATSRRISASTLPTMPIAMRFSDDASTLFVLGEDAARSIPTRGGRPTVLATFPETARLRASKAGHRYAVIDVGEERRVVDITRGVAVAAFPLVPSELVAVTDTEAEGFLVYERGIVTSVIIAATGTRIPLSARRFLGLSADLHRMATCTDDTLHVVRLDTQGEATPAGRCALAQEAAFLGDTSTLALREGTRIVLRAEGGQSTVLRATRTATGFEPFSANDRGEYAFPDPVRATLCLRAPGPLVSAVCTASPTEGRVPSVTSALFRP